MNARRLVAMLGLLTGLFAAGYGVMFTALDDFRDEYGISAGHLGFVVAAGFFAQFAAQVLLAPRADRGQAKRLVAIGLLCNLVGLLIVAFAQQLPLLLVGRLVGGLGAGMAVPAVRRIVILADPAHLGSNLGLLLAADVGGFAMGPVVAALLIGPFGIPAPFLAIAAATAACSPVLLRVDVNEGSADVTGSSGLAFDLLRIRPFVATILYGAAVFTMIGTFDALWVLVLDDLGSSEFVSNLGITVFALPLVVFGSLGGRIAQRVGPFRVGAVGLVAGSMFMFLYGLMPTGGAMLAIGIVHSISDSLTVSSSGVAVGMVVPASRQAAAQGLLGGTQTLVAGVIAIVAGNVYETFNRTAAYTTCMILMLAMVITGIVLAGSSFGVRGEVAEPPLEPVPG
ncbi:MAG: MFS transporter [Ilumatobacteraceae bacterium]